MKQSEGTRNRQGNIMCGECVCPIPDCPWMSCGRPVKDWDVELTVIKFSSGPVLTYSITSCPLFKPHPKSRLFDSEGRRIRGHS